MLSNYIRNICNYDQKKQTIIGFFWITKLENTSQTVGKNTLAQIPAKYPELPNQEMYIGRYDILDTL